MLNGKTKDPHPEGVSGLMLAQTCSRVHNRKVEQKDRPSIHWSGRERKKGRPLHWPEIRFAKSRGGDNGVKKVLIKTLAMQYFKNISFNIFQDTISRLSGPN